MVDFENIDEVDDVADDGPITPICLDCMMPVEPSDYYCSNCGEACNKLTQYIPFVNIQWMVNFWVKMWEQLWSREVSVVGRIFRLFMIIWFFPLAMLVLPFRKRNKTENASATDDEQQAADNEGDDV
jgi:hypothetical protein